MSEQKLPVSENREVGWMADRAVAEPMIVAVPPAVLAAPSWSEFWSCYALSLVFGMLGFCLSCCLAPSQAGRLGSRAGISSGIFIAGVYLCVYQLRQSSRDYWLVSIALLVIGVFGIYHNVNRMRQCDAAGSFGPNSDSQC